MSEPLGFIGLGRMGQGMAKNLLSAGHSLIVYDVDGARTDALRERGAALADSPAGVSEAAAVVFLCLPYSPEVEQVLFDERGVLAPSRENLTLVDTTTLSYTSAVDFAERTRARGAIYSDCPISGMPMRADDGTLTMMFGGDEAQFEIARPYLQAMGKHIFHCGDVGMGQVMKAINNIIYDINIVGMCEILPLAVKAGLKVDTVAAVVTSGSSRSFASEYFVPRILEGNFEGDFPMEAAYKDIDNVQEIAQRLRAATPVMNAMIATYQQTIAMGHGDEPKSAMIKLYEHVLDQRVRRS